MSQPKRFNSRKFRSLLENKIRSKGYAGVNTFARENKINRNPIARAVLGVTRPTLESLNLWCQALECTAEERAEIISSVYIDDFSCIGAA